MSDALARYIGAPGFLLDGLPRAHTHAEVDAAPAPVGGRFPIVLFSPGLGGVRTQNTAWAEEIASHGYVVVALDHPYDSAAVVLDDGKTVRTRVSATGNRNEDNRRAARWIAVRAGDLRFVRDQLNRISRGDLPDPLAPRLDTGHVAVTGHSLGGAAALQAARLDHRFTAVIDLDGAPDDPAPNAFPQPVLALTQEVTAQTDPDYLDRLTKTLDLSTSVSYRLTVPKSAHLSFTDAPLYLPPVPSIVGALGRTEGPRLTAAASLAFLDDTLRNRPGNTARQLISYGDLTIYRPHKHR